MNDWYVMVHGSYDCVFVGPFKDEAAATEWATTEHAKSPQFDHYPYHETNMRENIAEFGACAIQEP